MSESFFTRWSRVIKGEPAPLPFPRHELVPCRACKRMLHESQMSWDLCPNCAGE